LGVASEGSLDFWAERRLASKEYASERGERSLAFEDYDGLRFELVVADDGNPPLRAQHPDVPAQHAVLGVEGARAYASRGIEADCKLLARRSASRGRGRRIPAAGGAAPLPLDLRRAAGAARAAGRRHRAPHRPAFARRGPPGVAAARRRGAHAGDAGDRPRLLQRDLLPAATGILFEIATTSPGFAVDEDPDHLGGELRLPTQHERLRPQLERLLTPLTNPRAARRSAARS
jgi:glyoxalase family protein